VDICFVFFNLYSFKLRQGGEDKFRWDPLKRGKLDVRSFYDVLVPHDNTHFLWKIIWRNKATLRAVFFAWTTSLGKILTADNLRKRHVIIVDWCCICKRNEEFEDHVLLHYEIANALWSALFSRVGLAWVIPKRVIDLFACRKLGGSPQSAAMWKWFHHASKVSLEWKKW
jgi:hypothetical protein